MAQKSWQLSRRELIRGGGLALALPFLNGMNWAWGGEGKPSAEKMDSSEAFTGDPFCEPQGLNSVFDTDESTLAIVANANRALLG